MQNLNIRPFHIPNPPPVKLEIIGVEPINAAARVAHAPGCELGKTTLFADYCPRCRKRIVPRKTHLLVTNSKPRDLSALKRLFWIMLLLGAVGSFVIGDVVLTLSNQR